MIQHDNILGQQTPLRTATALDHWNQMTLAFLPHGATTPIHLGAPLEAEPDFAMGHLFCVMLGRVEMFETPREALGAFGEADFEAAYINLAQARQAMPTIGGNHAQRDVFERITIDAAIRAGFLEDATTLLEDRTALRGGHEDRYTAVQHELINRGRTASTQNELKIPAQSAQ